MAGVLAPRAHHPFDDLSVDISYSGLTQTPDPVQVQELPSVPECSCGRTECFVVSDGPRLFAEVESKQEELQIEATTNLITALKAGKITKFQEELRRVVRFQLYTRKIAP